MLRSLVCTGACTAVLSPLAACGPAPADRYRPPSVSLKVPRAAVQTVTARAPSNVEQPPAGTRLATDKFKRFALNALLVPLLDDDLPTRWADPGPAINCLDAAVSVDGGRLDVGAPVADAFTLHWRLDACLPLDENVEVSGEVELQVRQVAGRYIARVLPRALRVVSAEGSDVLDEPFHTEMTNSPDVPR